MLSNTTNETSLISIIMPAFNAAKTIIDSMNSIISQSYENWELIIIDDQSSDTTAEIIREYSEKDKRIKIITHNKKGVSSARNLGIHGSKGEYITFLDADDIYYNDALFYRAQYLNQHPDVSAVYCETEITDDKLLKLGWKLGKKDCISFEDFSGSPLHINSVMLRSKLLEDFRFDETYTNGEDWLMLSRIARKGIIFYKVKKGKVAYRQHDSTVRSDMLKHENELLRVIDILYDTDRQCLNPDPKYKNGLQKPSKKAVIYKRRLSLFLYLFFSEELEKAKTISDSLNSQAYGTIRLTDEDIYPIIKYSTMRYHLCHETYWKDFFYWNWQNNKKDYKMLLSDELYKAILRIIEKKKYAGLASIKNNVETIIVIFKRLVYTTLRKSSSLLCFSRLFSFKQIENASEKRLKICYIPSFQNQDEFTDQYYRILWYLNPLIKRIESIYVICSKKIETTPAPPPNYLDSNIYRHKDNFTKKFIYICDHFRQWKKVLYMADILIVWKEDYFYSDKRIKNLIQKNTREKKTWHVDHRNVRLSPSFYLKISHDHNPDFEKDIEESKIKFKKLSEMIDILKNNEKCYIFGTGPSLKKALDPHTSFEDGLTIACNSMVKNKALLNRLQPRIFVAADALFHAGCSKYAAAFRRDLETCLETYQAFLIVPFRDYKLYVSNLSEKLKPSVIGIPLEHIDKINFNLKDKFVVKSISNILTLFLIPLATTFSKKIYMMGFDGRKLRNKNYFWPHDKASQFIDKMDDIRRAHPAFFDIDYNDYYIEHCETLERWLTEGEKLGFRFRNLTYSYIPALQKRTLDYISQ